MKRRRYTGDAFVLRKNRIGIQLRRQNMAALFAPVEAELTRSLMGRTIIISKIQPVERNLE
jgi:hypothetical protein